MLKAEAVPKDAAGVQFAWTSSDSEVASVDDGAVTAKKEGTATITVSSGAIKKDVVVTVTIEQIALVSINVDRPAVAKSVDDTAKVTATAVPANATNVVYEWSSDNTDVATVDQTGIITITGVGAAKVTVKFGTVSKVIEVEGLIKGITVKDAAGQTEGQNPLGSVFQLFAAIDPENTGITPEWFVNNDNIATVDANGKVTVIGSGTTLITARVGNIIGEYMLSTESLYDQAVAYWTFDDPNNPGINLIAGGGDMEINYDVVKFVKGMTESDGAIQSGIEVRGEGEENIVNAVWNHTMVGHLGPDGKGVGVVTMMMDLKVMYVDYAAEGALREAWAPLYTAYNGSVPGMASMCVLWVDYNNSGRHNGICLGIKNNPNTAYMWPAEVVKYTKETLTDNEPWIRLVFTVLTNDPPGDPKIRLRFYLNGDRQDQFNGNTESSTVNGEVEGDPYEWPGDIQEGQPIHFFSYRKSDKRVKGSVEVTRLAVWNKLLTDDEIKSLGGISESEGGIPEANIPF
jgi:hypothetical protein